MARSTKDNSSAEIPTRPRYYHDSSAQQITPSCGGENLIQCQSMTKKTPEATSPTYLPHLLIVLSHLGRHSGRAREHTRFARGGAEARTKDVRSSRHKNQLFPPPADIHTAHTTSPPTSPSPKSFYQLDGDGEEGGNNSAEFELKGGDGGQKRNTHH